MAKLFRVLGNLLKNKNKEINEERKMPIGERRVIQGSMRKGSLGIK